MYKCHNVAPFGLKNGRAQYGESQRGRKNGKDKRGGKNRKGKRSEGGYCGNKVNPIVGESNGSEASVYYHIIYRCYQGLIVLR